jgi:hypothetical protein
MTPEEAARRRLALLEKASRHLLEGLSALVEASALAPRSVPAGDAAAAAPKPDCRDPLPLSRPPAPAPAPAPSGSPEPADPAVPNPFLSAAAAGPKINPFRLEFETGSDAVPDDRR